MLERKQNMKLYRPLEIDLGPLHLTSNNSNPVITVCRNVISQADLASIDVGT